jgi:hypothetical protein
MTDKDKEAIVTGIELPPNTRRLKNGAIYDMDKKRIVANPGGGLAAFDPDTARQAQARKQERKRETIQAAANAAVENEQLTRTHGDMAFVAAVAQTAYLKATTPDDPKAIDAARFLLQEAGIAEQKQAAEQPAAGGARLTLDISAETAEQLVQALLAEQQRRQAGTVDAQWQAAEKETDG